MLQLMRNVIWGENMNDQKLVFENPDNAGKYLICPKCREKLYPADLESLAICPYCDCKIGTSDEIEDFAIDPVVRQWMDRYKNQ